MANMIDGLQVSGRQKKLGRTCGEVAGEEKRDAEATEAASSVVVDPQGAGE